MPSSRRRVAKRNKLLGVAEVLGAVGLVAPMATGIAPFMTRVAAVCLAALMEERWRRT